MNPALFFSALFILAGTQMKERRKKRKRYDSESESSDSFTSSSSFSSSLSSSSFSTSSSSSSSTSKRRKKSGGKKSRRHKEKKRKKKSKKKKEKKWDADSRKRRRERREEAETELDSKKKKKKNKNNEKQKETLKKEITEAKVAPSAPTDDNIGDQNNIQSEVKDELKSKDAPAPAVDTTPPVPGFGAAMTLEQYRELAKQKTYLRGTVHAKDKAEADAENKDKQDKLSRGWWSCQSYKCDGHMNPKMMEKCNQCGAMRTLSKSGATFSHRASDAQIAFNANRR
jgi:hypothetical protein